MRMLYELTLGRWRKMNSSRGNKDSLLVALNRGHHINLSRLVTRHLINTVQFFPLLPATTDPKRMRLGVENPYIQVDDTRIRGREVQVLRNFREIEAWQLRSNQALENLPVPIGINLLTSEAISVPKALDAPWVWIVFCFKYELTSLLLRCSVSGIYGPRPIVGVGKRIEPYPLVRTEA